MTFTSEHDDFITAEDDEYLDPQAQRKAETAYVFFAGPPVSSVQQPLQGQLGLGESWGLLDTSLVVSPRLQQWLPMGAHVISPGGPRDFPWGPT